MIQIAPITSIECINPIPYIEIPEQPSDNPALYSEHLYDPPINSNYGQSSLVTLIILLNKPRNRCKIVILVSLLSILASNNVQPDS